MRLMNAIVKLSAAGLAMTLIAGCATARTSRVPEFIRRLNQHEFTKEQRAVVGDILHYVNELETK